MNIFAKKIIEESRAEIDNNNFEALFEKLKNNPNTTSYDIGVVANFLMNDCGIDILRYLKSIPENCFYNSMMDHYDMPGWITNIGAHAFAGSTLKSIKLSPNLETIDSGAFSRSSLQSIELPDSVRYLGWSVFKECRNLKYVKLSNSMTAITTNTFDGCRALEYVDIPDSIKQIHRSAFKQCGNLKEITIPESVNDIASSAFTATPKIVNVVKASYADRFFNELKERKNIKRDFIRYI